MRLLHLVSIALLALSSTVYSYDIANDYVVHGRMSSNIQHGWSLHSIESSPNSNYKLNMKIAIKQNESGVSELEQYLLSHSSNPQSHLYGQHLTREQINNMVAPPQHRVQSVVEWLNTHGINDITHSDGSDFVSFKVTVQQANKLLNTQYKTYVHSNGMKAVRTNEYMIPKHLTEHIDYIAPTTRMPIHTKSYLPQSYDSKTKKYNTLTKLHSNINIPSPPHFKYNGSTPNTTSSISISLCSQLATPECIRQIYGFANYQVKAADKNGIGVTAYIGQYYQNENLKAAMTTFTFPYYPQYLDQYNVTVKGNAGDPQGRSKLVY